MPKCKPTFNFFDENHISRVLPHDYLSQPQNKHEVYHTNSLNSIPNSIQIHRKLYEIIGTENIALSHPVRLI